MAYSQPTTRLLNVSGVTGSGPGVPSFQMPSGRTPMSKQGAYLDNRNPDRLYQSRIAASEELTGFISKLIGDKNSGATKWITESIQRDATRQAGEIIADQKPGDVPLQMQPRWREINPYVQTKIAEQQAISAGQDYARQLNAAVTKRPLLAEPSEGNEELKAQQAVLFAEAQQEASDASGLTQVTPYLRMGIQQQISQGDALVRGALTQSRAEKATVRAATTSANQVASAIAEFEGGAATFENTGTKIQGLRMVLEQQLDTLKTQWTTEQAAQIIGDAINRQLPEIIDGADDLNLTLQDLKSLTTQEIEINGVNIWDVVDKNGKSLRLRLQEQIRAAADIRDDRVVGLATQDALQLVKDGRGEEAVDRIIEAGMNVSDPSNVKLITQAFSTINKPLTNAQKANEMEFLNRNANGEEWADMWPEIFANGKAQTISPGFVSRIGTNIANGTTLSTAVASKINGAYTSLQQRGELGLAEAAVNEAAGRALGGGGVSKEVSDNLARELRGRYARLVEQKVKEDPRYDVVGNMSADLDQVKNDMIQELKGGPSKAEYSTFGPAKAARELSMFREQAIQSGGRLNESLFTPYITELAKQISGNDTPTIKDKVKALVSLLATTKNADGSLLYSSRDEAVAAVREALEGGKEGSAWNSYGEFNFETDYSGATEAEARRILQDAGVQPKEDMSNVKEVGETLSNAALRQMSYTTDPEAVVINEENYPTLARALNGEPLAIVAALPQLDPASVTQQVSTAFNSQNSGLFIAIGIAEGTRTANGGYTKAWSGHTDPGDGHWNRGTVSGGRGSRLSPEQVDRQWRGILAQTAGQVVPVLKQMGLQPSTVAFNNVLFSAVDLRVQAPAALPGYLQNISRSRDFSIEGIAKARADAFFNDYGRLDTTFPSYTALLRDQRSRAGVLQFRRRI